MIVEIPSSVGDLLDRITILEIKCERLTEADKRALAQHELELLKARWQELELRPGQLGRLRSELKATNERLWDIEDAIRDCERRHDFGAQFVELARSVYLTNDLRFELKSAINRLSGSEIVEEKSYTAYR